MPLFQNESVQNLSYEKESDLHENEPVAAKHFHMNSFAIRFLLTQRQEATTYKK